MPLRTDVFDIGRLRLASGEGRRLDLFVDAGRFDLGGATYGVAPAPLPVRLDVSRTTARGYALRLRFGARLDGPCMRCLEAASPGVEVESREIDIPGENEDLTSPYIEDELLDLRAWTRDALALALPAQVLCRADCAGLCPQCGVNLNEAGPEHGHDTAPDPRWAKLRDLRLE